MSFRVFSLDFSRSMHTHSDNKKNLFSYYQRQEVERKTAALLQLALTQTNRIEEIETMEGLEMLRKKDIELLIERGRVDLLKDNVANFWYVSHFDLLALPYLQIIFTFIENKFTASKGDGPLSQGNLIQWVNHFVLLSLDQRFFLEDVILSFFIKRNAQVVIPDGIPEHAKEYLQGKDKDAEGKVRNPFSKQYHLTILRELEKLGNFRGRDRFYSVEQWFLQQYGQQVYFQFSKKNLQEVKQWVECMEPDLYLGQYFRKHVRAISQKRARVNASKGVAKRASF